MLGAFSISLTVKDIRASKAFYEKLGFSEFAGEIEQSWLVMKNGEHLIGLFSGMFDKNMLTFNPAGIKTHKPLQSLRMLIRLANIFKTLISRLNLWVIKALLLQTQTATLF